MTYTPPTRKKRRRRYEDKVKYAPEVQESNCCTSEMGFRTEEESPQLEPAVQPRGRMLMRISLRTVADFHHN